MNMPGAPDISFVIAAYNAEETLKRAIDSALGQEAVSVEVLVVDDCSTDATMEIAQSSGDRRVRLIRQSRNGGPGAARNAGIAAATGQWIAILDSDDAVRPQRSRRMIECAHTLSAQIVVDNLDVVPMEGGGVERMFKDDDLRRQPTLELADFIASNVIFRSTFNFGYMKPIFRRDFLRGHRLTFDERLRIGEDYILLVSALASGGRCAVEPTAGYIYHVRSGSISRVLEQHHVDAMLAADEDFISRFALGPEAMTAQRRRTRSLIEARSFLALVDQLKERSVGGFLKAAISNPSAMRHLRMPIAVRVRRLARLAGIN